MIRLVVLGSGASLPTLQRHNTSVALQHEGDLFLIDCGEGTQLQWRRAGLRFSKLKAVLISHLHGDHINGLVGFLQTLSLSDRTAPLALLGPPGMRDYIRAARKHLGLRLTYELNVEEHAAGIIYAGGDYRIACATLDHGVPTLGFRFEEDERAGRFDTEAAARLGVPEGPLFGVLQRGEPVTLDDGRVVAPADVLGPPRRGKVVAYCVDTRPTEAVIRLAEAADLFLCDSTFGDDMKDEAGRRGHSTASQAAGMSVAAGARLLMLIHISARYHDPRQLVDEARAVFPESRVADDLMELVV
jgi:ribonuclease Z